MANIFDRIFKENITSLIPALTQKTIGIQIGKTMELKDKLQVTLEREADFLQLVLHPKKADNFILHLEFQTGNDRNMLRRMLQYRALLYDKHGLFVKQVVYYFGQKPCIMKNELRQDGLHFQYQIINIHDFDYETFIHSNQPEEVILAILCDFKDKSPHEVIRSILQKINHLAGYAGGKYIRQLEVLSNLRNLQEETKKEVRIMPFNIDLSKDRLYVQGKKEEKENSKKILLSREEEIVTNLIEKLGLSAEQAAEIANVSLTFAKKIAAKIKNK